MEIKRPNSLVTYYSYSYMLVGFLLVDSGPMESWKQVSRLPLAVIQLDRPLKSKFHMNLIHFPAFGRIRLHFCIDETGKSHQHFFWKGKKKIVVAVFSGGGGCSVRANTLRQARTIRSPAYVASFKGSCVEIQVADRGCSLCRSSTNARQLRSRSQPLCLLNFEAHPAAPP